MHKKWWLLAGLLSIPFALADINSTFMGIWNKVLSIGNLSFLGVSDGGAVVAFTRILIGILAFTLFFGVITVFGGKGGGKSALSFFNKNQAMIVSAVLAVMTSVFLPAEVLLAVGSGWATAMAFVLIGGPIVGIGYMLFNLTKWVNNGVETRGIIFLKIMLCLLLFWVLSAMRYHAARLL